jgi:hypothetical protein
MLRQTAEFGQKRSLDSADTDLHCGLTQEVGLYMSGSSSRSSVPNEAIEFAGFILAHCAAIADSNRAGELICPFAVFGGDEGRRVIDFESQTQEEAVSKGWASLAEAKSNTESWAFGREGLYREPDGKAFDVLTVTVWIPGMKELYSVLQRFGRQEDQAIYLVEAPKLLKHMVDSAEPVEDWDVMAVERGVAKHPKGEKWAAWRAH